METSLRGDIEETNIKKSSEIIDDCRVSPVLGKPNAQASNKLKEVFKSKA